jgi:rubrerythrin
MSNENVPTFEEHINETMADIPNKNNPGDDAQILRSSIIAELDAINLYKQFAEIAKNPKIKETLLDIAKEEKTHIGEFETLLKEIDPEFSAELIKGAKEVNEE